MKLGSRIIEVTWEDCSGRHGWLTPPELAEFIDDREFIINTVGYVQTDDAKGIVVIEAQPAIPYKKDHRMIGCVTFIPRSAVRQVRELRMSAMSKKKTKPPTKHTQPTTTKKKRKQGMVETQATNKRKKGGQKKKGRKR